MECTTLLSAMYTAYGVYGKGPAINPRMPEINGGPGWISSDTYDIAAKSESYAPFPTMAGPMLRALLEDRFKLKVHVETKEVPVYFLMVAKNGPRLEPTKEGSCVPIDQDHPPSPLATPGEPRPTVCGAGSVKNKGSLVTMTEHGEPFTAVFLSQMVGRPVLDRTGLTGRYEIQMEFAPEGMADGPSIFEVLQQQLGLKLEPGKGPSEILVIDHVERPIEN